MTSKRDLEYQAELLTVLAESKQDTIEELEKKIKSLENQPTRDEYSSGYTTLEDAPAIAILAVALMFENAAEFLAINKGADLTVYEKNVRAAHNLRNFVWEHNVMGANGRPISHAEANSKADQLYELLSK